LKSEAYAFLETEREGNLKAFASAMNDQQKLEWASAIDEASERALMRGRDKER
jgi:hypothetical protein